MVKAGTWQVGCYTRPWSRFEYQHAFDAIARAGYRYVGLMTTRRKSRLVITAADSVEYCLQVGRAAKQRGLNVVSVYGGGLPLGRGRKGCAESLRRLIDNCAAAGSPSLLLGGVGRREHLDPYYGAIADCCDYAAEQKVELALKPHGGLNATGPQCKKLIERVNHANFRLWYDPGNVFFYSEGKLDPAWDCESVAGLVTGMCVKDYVQPRNVLVTPGTGMVDFAAVMAHLQSGGFTSGPLVVETLKPGDANELLAEAIKARKFVEELAGIKRD